MSKNLNQAFIRAYAKGKVKSLPADQQSAAVQEYQDSLIMRVDTTSVLVPEPHVTKQRPIAVKMTGSQNTPSILPNQQSNTSQEPADLRFQIAQEMLRAGQWNNPEVAAMDTTLFEGRAAQSPAKASPNTKAAKVADSSTEIKQSASSNQVTSSANDVIENELTSAAPESYTSDSKSKTQGSIVRVDAPPAYTAPVDRVEKASVKSMPKQDSIRMVKQKEQDLQRAKLRIFNPVWEVDQLQWPEVCLRLIESKTDTFSQVARHLVEACQEGLQVLAVTSPQSGEGRTTVACCLAKLASSQGLKVAILDGDIDNPTLCLQTNLEIENDWCTAIVNQMALEEVAVHSIDDQLTLIPLNQPVNPDELSNDDLRISDMIRELSESFDLVILDTGSMNSPNGMLISLAEQGLISAAIAVVDHRNTTSQRVDACIRRIRQAGVTSIGVVENFAA